MSEAMHANDNCSPTDVELQLEVDEHGRVWAILDGDCHMIGRRDAVRLELKRFLNELDAET